MSNNLVETLIGALVLVIAGVFLSFAYSRANMGGIDGYRVIAKFDRADGLTIGSDVRMSGIKVGTVTEQALDPQTYQARIALAINAGVQLPADTSAKITAEGLLGGNYVSLVPGGAPDYLGDGDEIEFTQGSIDLLGLIGRAIYGAGTGAGGGDSGAGAEGGAPADPLAPPAQ